MSENKCNKCESFIKWIEIDPDVWRPFDFGTKQATPEEPLRTPKGRLITSGLKFVSHFKTCDERIRKAQAQARKDRKAREARKKDK